MNRYAKLVYMKMYSIQSAVLSLKVRELSNALIDTRTVGTQTGISMRFDRLIL
ncbi:MAG: hypothetical protein LBM69_06090 [Lachnospiraceae bacterium]|nr:hypothetical protein [Lachnospiraceae bacterium]